MRVLRWGRCGPLLPYLEAMVCPACRCVLMLGSLHLVGLFLVDAVISICLLHVCLVRQNGPSRLHPPLPCFSQSLTVQWYHLCVLRRFV